MTLIPRVSVVMGVHNEVGRVGRAVDSILQQSLTDLELIVIDDGSTDGSGALLDRMAAADARLMVVHQTNAGLTRSLIHGCERARAAVIARQDADDWSAPKRLQGQLELLEADPRLGFVSCGTQYVGPQGEPLTTVSRDTHSEQATEALLNRKKGPPAHGSVMFRQSVYRAAGSYREQFYFAQDSDLWLRMAEHSLFGFHAPISYFHRKDAGSISGVRRPQQSAFAGFAHACRRARVAGESETTILQAAESLASQLRQARSAGNAPQAEMAMDITYLIGSQLALNGDPRSRSYLTQVLRKNPLHLKAWVRLVQSVMRKASTRTP